MSDFVKGYLYFSFLTALQIGIGYGTYVVVNRASLDQRAQELIFEQKALERAWEIMEKEEIENDKR